MQKLTEEINLIKALEEVSSKFKYTPDTGFVDTWNILKKKMLIYKVTATISP